MALRLSTLASNMLAGEQVTYTATTIAAEAAGNKITDSANGLLDAGFRPGMILEISGFTGDAGNNQIAVVTSVESDGSEMVVVTENALVNDAAGESVTLTAYGQCLKDLLHLWRAVYLYGQPADQRGCGAYRHQASGDHQRRRRLHQRNINQRIGV